MTKTAEDLLSNPKFKAFIDAFSSIRKASQSLSLGEARKLSTAFFLSKETLLEKMHRIENIHIESSDNYRVPVRLYIPTEATKLPVIVYFHRGGFVFGNVEEADPICRKLAHHFSSIVISVDYRLAPENPFPKPLEDCYAVTKWAAQNITIFGGDSNQITVCGESAGGNLAGAVTYMSLDKGGPSISSQILICPMISSSIDLSAYENSVDQYFITKEAIEFFWNVYIQDEALRNHPYASLDKSSHIRNLPPALIITAEYDPLREEAERYASKLKDAGVNVLYRCFNGVVHGFIDLPIYDAYQKSAWMNEIEHLHHKI